VAPNVVGFAWFENSRHVKDKGQCSGGERALGTLTPALCKIDDREIIEPQLHYVASYQFRHQYTVSGVVVPARLLLCRIPTIIHLVDLSLERNSLC
jgi:hypothetical protein